MNRLFLSFVVSFCLAGLGCADATEPTASADQSASADGLMGLSMLRQPGPGTPCGTSIDVMFEKSELQRMLPCTADGPQSSTRPLSRAENVRIRERLNAIKKVARPATCDPEAETLSLAVLFEHLDEGVNWAPAASVCQGSETNPADPAALQALFDTLEEIAAAGKE
jgi:hypothetical protein